jgi:hypothetical protein
MDVYGAGHVYNAIAPERGADCIRGDPNIVGLGVGRRLPIAGALPMLCPHPLPPIRPDPSPRAPRRPGDSDVSGEATSVPLRA